MRQLSIVYNSKKINSIYIDNDSNPDPEDAIKVLTKAISHLKKKQAEDLEKRALMSILERAKKLEW